MTDQARPSNPKILDTARPVLRHQRVMTPAKLAKLTGIEPGRLDDLERELVVPTVDELDRLATTLRAPEDLPTVSQSDRITNRL